MKSIFWSRSQTCAFGTVWVCILFVSLLFVSLLGGLVPAQAAPVTLSLSQLLQKHRNADATPEARRDTAALKVVYDVSAGGLAGTMTTYEAMPHKSRMELQLGPIGVTTGTDGKITWEQDGTGNVRILGGEELSERTADTGFSLESFDPLKKDTAGVVTLRPALDAETGCYVLDVKPKGGSSQTIYLDPKTYLVSKTVERKGGLVGSITIDAYEKHNGTQVPSRMHIQYGGLPIVIDTTLQSVVRLPGAAAALFTPPALPKDWQFLAPGPRVAVTVSFIVQDNEIVLPVTVNGHPLRLLLDSGSGSSFVTAQAAQAAGLTTQGNLPALGYGGTAETALSSDATVEIGGVVRLSHQTLHVITDPAIAKLLSAHGNVDGAIGYELFTRLIVGIDYTHKTLTLSDPASPPSPLPTDAVTVPLKLENRMPTVMAAIDGRDPARFLVDTGDAGAVHLYSQYATAQGLMPTPNMPNTQIRQGAGVGGRVTETLTPGHSLRLGSTLLRNLPLATMTGPGIAGLSSQAGGIGNQFLSGFDVTFDYAHSQLILRPLSPPKSMTPSTSQPSLALALETLPGGTASPGLTLEALLQKHLAALGGEAALTAIKNTKITSTVETGGIQGSVVSIYAAPDREFEEDKLGILDNLQGYDGRNAWERDTNGNVRALAGDELKDLRVQLFFDTNSYVIPGRIPGKMTLRPQTEVGTGNYIIDALPEGGKPTTLFFDPKSYLIVKEQHYDDDVLVTTTYADYRTVDGTQFPFKTVTTNGTARYDITSTVTKVENNVAISPGLFSPPVGGKKFSFVKPGQTRAVVPFDLDDGEIGFEVRLNGTPARVFLDSGAGGIALSQATATQLGLKSSGFLEVRGYGGSADQHPVLIKRLEVPGAVALTDVAAIAVALPETLNAYFTRPLAGFVGYDLLAHCAVRVDYFHKTLTFIQSDSFHPTAADGVMLPLDLDNDLPSIHARLDTLPARRYLIDTGDSDAAVRLYGPYIAQNGLDKKYPHGAMTVGGGIGGVSRSRTTRIGSFTVAGVTFRNLPADFSLDTRGGASQVNAGSLGSRLLSRFIVTFDYPHSRVFFAPAPNARAAFVTLTTGISLMTTKETSGRAHVIVAEILPNAPARTAGLSQLDEVLAIDGQSTAQIGLVGARRLLSVSASRKSHTLRVQSSTGKPRTISVTSFDPLQ